MSKYKRLGKNVVLVFFGNAGSKLLNLLLLPFYTRWLSVEDYGITDMLNVYVMLLTGLVTASIAEAVFVFPKTATKEEQKSYFSSGLFIAIVFLAVAAILFLLSRYLFIKWDYESIFTDYTPQIYALLFVNFLQSYFQQFCRGIDKMKIYSTTGIILTVSTALFSFFFIPQLGVDGFIIAMILASFTAAVYSITASGGLRFFAMRLISKSHYLEMLKYSVPLIPNALMWWFIGYLNRPLIESYAGLKEVGLLAVANKFPSAVTMVFAVFFYSWQISVMEEFGKKDYKAFYNNILKVLVFALCLCSIGLAIFSELIIGLMTSESYHKAWVYIPILALAPLFQAISSFSSANFMAAKTTKYVFYSSIVGAIASLALNFTLIPVLGLWGAVISIVIAHILMAVTRVCFAWRYVELTEIKLLVITLMLTAIIALAIIFIINSFYKWLSIIAILTALLLLNRKLLAQLVLRVKSAYENYRK